MKTFKNILLSIIAVPLTILGAVCLTPIIMILMIIELPCCVVQDIWKDKEEISNE